MIRSLLFTASALALSACNMLEGGSDRSGNDTVMRNVEILPGTASDEMILLDTASGDGTAVDPSSAVGPAPPPTAADDEDESADGGGGNARSPGTNADNGDEVVTPPAGGAEPDRPAEETKR